MRQIGTLSHEADARRFAAFLVTSGVTAHAEQEGEGWAIWVRDENQVEAGRSAFQDFRHNPDDARYRGVERTAGTILREESKRREQAQKNVISMRGRWGRAAMRRRPLVLTLIALSVGVGLGSNMGQLTSGVVMRSLLFCDVRHVLEGQAKDPTDPLIDIRQGQLWRLITPIFVHYGPMHLAFNMIMLYQLGSMIEDRRGTWRVALLTLAIAACSNTAQAVAPWGGSPFAAGMSGVVYGLFGYIWMKSIYAPELGLHISRGNVAILLIWLLLGFSGFFQQFDVRIANWTHGIGFLVGLLIGYGPELFRSGVGR